MATLVPPDGDDVPAMNCGPGAPVVENVRTCGPPPDPGPVVIRIVRAPLDEGVVVEVVVDVVVVVGGGGGGGGGASGVGAQDGGALNELVESTGPCVWAGVGPPACPHQFC
ncbi:MAG: hypothetical protein JO054_02230 [Actinobacteria bacterium]|nr:hypothetical protein [Actinomycetota bacterium]